MNGASSSSYRQQDSHDGWKLDTAMELGDPKGLLATAEVALHKTHCGGFCGFHCQEPKEMATVFVTDRDNMATALEVGFRRFSWSCDYGCIDML